MRASHLLLAAALLGTLALADRLVTREPSGREGLEGSHFDPSDWWENQRAFPGAVVNAQAYAAALDRARLDQVQAQLTTSAAAPTWVQAGPYNIGGRVTALAVAPGGTTLYLGAANGGVFKSVNSGVNWTAVLDHTGMEVFSIGALALDPNDPNTIYVGTGEANASVDSYDGQGVLRSTDGGATWKSLGLVATARIARIAVDPSNSQRIFVAAMGTQFSTSSDRGLYRSEDGGAHWTQVLYVSDSTGADEVVINPLHPDTVFCATWERVRHPTYRRAYGPECGIWRSIDHGTTWTRLTNGLPVPSDAVGRIALGLCATHPSIIYAQIVGGAPNYLGLGMYRSSDGGATWARTDVAGFTDRFGGFGWYFGDMAVDPNDPDIVFLEGQYVGQSVDGGATFAWVVPSMHPDFHGMWIDPANGNHCYFANDAGFFWTFDLNGFGHSADLPISQFYAGAVDPNNGSRLSGGTQDNDCLITSGSPTAWNSFNFGADGFYTGFDPSNPNILFAEWQYGCSGRGPRHSTDGGASWFFGTGTSTTDRWNWCAPFVMDPQDHNTLLCASHRVYKSTNNGSSYFLVSGDLTSYPNPASSLVYHTISTLDISPVSRRIYYAGTDDGRVWRSLDAGTSWQDISAGLPLFAITRVTADPVDSTVVYVCQSGFGQDLHSPHVFRGTANGSVWTAINGDLPDAPANDLVVDPSNTSTLYLGTDLGVYMTGNGGATWYPLGQGMPLQAVFDLTLHQPSRTLVAATHGRSQWKLDLTTLPVAVEGNAAPARLALSAPAPNPSRGVTRFDLALPQASSAEVAVFDAAGRRVRTLFSGTAPAGRTTFAWDGRDASGRRAGAGVYFVRGSAAGATEARRIVRVN